MLIGETNVQKLANAHVLVAGLGGVGGYAAEQLCRAGIGELTLLDGDSIQPSNLNRQLIALHSTMGMDKTKAMADRLLDINPEIRLNLAQQYLKEDHFDNFLNHPYSFIVDAIDTLSPKVALLEAAIKHGRKVVSSMGSGGKLIPEKIEVADISESHHCKFAYIIRKYLHRKGIYSGIPVVYSPEPVSRNAIKETCGEENKRSVVGTISYMPPIFGCFCASVAIRYLLTQ